MANIKFNIESCKGCELCVHACPLNNIEMSGEINRGGSHYAQVIDEQKCNGCGLCRQMCPDLVIEVKK